MEQIDLALYADDANLLGEHMNMLNKTTETLLEASKEHGLEDTHV
jgi:hypothetical protein